MDIAAPMHRSPHARMAGANHRFEPTTSPPHPWHQRIGRLTLLWSAMLAITTSPGPAADLAQTFRTPPESSKPAVYWYWMFGNINTNSIGQELDLMRKLGIGQAFMADI